MAVKGRAGYRYHPFGQVCPSPVVTSGMYWPRTIDLAFQFHGFGDVTSVTLRATASTPTYDTLISVAGWSDHLVVLDGGTVVAFDNVSLQSIATQLARISFDLHLVDVLLSAVMDATIVIDVPVEGGQGFQSLRSSVIDYGVLTEPGEAFLALIYDTVAVEGIAVPW